MFKENILKLLGNQQIIYEPAFSSRLHPKNCGYNIESLMFKYIYPINYKNINLRKPIKNSIIRFSALALYYADLKTITEILIEYKNSNIKILEFEIVSKLKLIQCDDGNISLLNNKFKIDFNDDSQLYLYKIKYNNMTEIKLQNNKIDKLLLPNMKVVNFNKKVYNYESTIT